MRSIGRNPWALCYTKAQQLSAPFLSGIAHQYFWDPSILRCLDSKHWLPGLGEKPESSSWRTHTWESYYLSINHSPASKSPVPWWCFLSFLSLSLLICKMRIVIVPITLVGCFTEKIKHIDSKVIQERQLKFACILRFFLFQSSNVLNRGLWTHWKMSALCVWVGISYTDMSARYCT